MIRLNGTCMPTLIRNCQTFLFKVPSLYANMCESHSGSTLPVLAIIVTRWNVALLVVVVCCLGSVLIFISLLPNNFERLYMCLIF